MSSRRQAPQQNLPVVSHLAHGDGWSISDIVCTAGPHDQSFEEHHSRSGIGIVVSGTFQYRTSTGSALMTPGSILLGNHGDCYCCGHDHSTGDRCIAFTYTPDFLERVTAIPGRRNPRFKSPRIPAVRVAAKAVVRATAYLLGNRETSAEELSIFVAGEATEITQNGDVPTTPPTAAALSRVTRVVRIIDEDPSAPHDLSNLAKMARLSPYHFLRTFEGVTGATPHQYVLRARLRRAALKLKMSNDQVLDIALACGFGDVSNFNRTFRAEFGMSPRRFRSNG